MKEHSEITLSFSLPLPSRLGLRGLGQGKAKKRGFWEEARVQGSQEPGTIQ